MIENVGNELKAYFEGKPLLSSLLVLDMYILLGCSVLRFLDIFVYLGGIISGLLFYVFILGILLCIANKNFFALIIGLGIEALINLIYLIRYLARHYGFSWSSLFGLLIYGFFTYMAFKKYSAKTGT
ncbi:MAG: hypothetical protein GX022_06180 [Clostridiaceae bacterium]|nr:hypothetical protein [Clostridiaceae bacterium]